MEFWIGGVPQKSHLKIFEIDYGEFYRSISSFYEKEFHFWFLSQEDSSGTLCKKMQEIKIKNGEKTGEVNFDSLTLPSVNPKNPEAHFVSSYAKVIPSSPDPIVNQYIGEDFTNILTNCIIQVDINQQINGKPLREAIKTIPTATKVKIKAVIKPIIATVINGVTTRQIDTQNSKTVDVEIAGLGFTAAQAEEITVIDIPFGLI